MLFENKQPSHWIIVQIYLKINNYQNNQKLQVIIISNQSSFNQ